MRLYAYNIMHVRTFNPRKCGVTDKNSHQCVSHARSRKTKGHPAVTSVVTTIQCFSRMTSAVTRDQLIYHGRYYKIYIRTRFYISNTVTLSSRIYPACCNKKLRVKHHRVIDHQLLHMRGCCTFLNKIFEETKNKFFKMNRYYWLQSKRDNI